MWIENSDVEQIANEITATVSAVFDTTLKKFLEPTNPHQNRLFKEVMGKQLHSCSSQCHHKNVGTCKSGFSFPIHSKTKKHITHNQEDGIIIDPEMSTET